MRRVLCLTLLLIVACHRKPSTPADVIARVGERMVTSDELKRYVDRNTGTDLGQMGAQVQSAMLDQYLEEITVSEYAAAHGVEIPAETIAAAVRTDAGSTVLEKRDEMRREKLIGSIAAEVPEPSDAAVRDYYAMHIAEFRSGEELHVRQILVHDEPLANQIVDQLRKGASFEDLSARYSLAPNSKKGGDIGFVSRGELPRMFEDVIFALQPGSVSSVIRTDATFHVFKVDERRPAGTLDLPTAAPVIRQKLREEETRQRIAQLVARARSELQVVVLTRRAPWYAGTLPKSDTE